MTIGELARRAGVGVETIRFYQREGLVEEPPRPTQGYRRYSPEIVRRVRFIKRAQELGFTLREVGELLRLRVEVGAACGEARARAHAKLADIDTRIRSLERMRVVLLRLSDACGEGGTHACPILDALDLEEESP